MKSKIFLVFALLITAAVILAGCNIDFFKDNDESKGSDDTQPAVDKVTSKIDFTFAEYKTTFFINDSSGYVQTINVKFYDSEGREINTGKVSWEDNLPSGTEKHSTVNSFTFNAKTVNTLGDYTITATVVGNDKISKSYTFAQRSRNTLDTSLTYSYVSPIEFEFDDDYNIKGIVSAIELNEAGTKIEYPAARMELSNTIRYRANGNSMLMVSAKEGTDFGVLSASITDGSDIVYLPVGKNQFLLWSPEAVEGSFSLSIMAGNKDIRTVTIIVEKPTSETLPDPLLDVSLAPEGENGKIVSITGDNVGDDDDCNYLFCDVQIKDDDGNYVDYDFVGNNLSHDIQYGYQVHLNHCGEYKVMAYLLDSIGNYSYAEKTVSVEPYTFPTIKITSVEQVEKIYNSTDHMELWKTTESIAPSIMTTIEIEPKSPYDDKEKYKLTILHEGDDIRSTKSTETNFTEKEFSSKIEIDLKYAGTNKLRIERISTPGYGYPVDSKKNTEDTMYEDYFEKEIIILGDSYYENKEIINLSVNDNSTMKISAGYELNDNEYIYVALFRKNGENQEEYVADRDENENGYILSKSTKTIEYKYDPGYIYLCKYYVFAKYDQIPSSIQKKYAPLYKDEYVPRLSVKKTPDKNESTVTITNYKNYGRLTPCYYIISDSLALPGKDAVWNTVTESEWELVTEATYKYDKTVQYSETKYVWLKYPWNRSNDGEEVIEYEYAVCRLDVDSAPIDDVPVITVQKLRNDKERKRITRFLIENNKELELYYSIVNSSDQAPSEWKYLSKQKEVDYEINYDKEINIKDRYLWVKVIDQDKKETIIGSIDVCLKRVYPESAIFTIINDSDEIQTEYGVRQFRLDNIKTYNGKNREIYYSIDGSETWNKYDSNKPLVKCSEDLHYRIDVRVVADEDDYVVKTRDSVTLSKHSYMPVTRSPYLHYKYHPIARLPWFGGVCDADVTFTCDDAKIKYESIGLKKAVEGYADTKNKGKKIKILDNVKISSLNANSTVGVIVRQAKKGYLWSRIEMIYIEPKTIVETVDKYTGDRL